MTDERKATEVILTMENLLKEILGHIKNIDLKYSLLIKKIEKIDMKQPLPEVEVVFPDYQPTQQAASKFGSNSDLKSKIQLALEEAQRDTEQSDQLTVETHQNGKRRNLRVQGDSQIRQIPVQQRITYEDGKNIYMASVEISDIDGNLVKKTNTNQVGKWQVPLSPGDYEVNVTKAGTAIKPKVELCYKINIPNQDSTVELETRKV